MKRILAALLTVVLLLGTLTIGISAKKITPVYEIDEQTKKETDEIDYEATLAQYLTTKFESAEEKLAEMDLMYEKNGYQLWVDTFTGEVATKNTASGQILFSNPYDVATSGSDSVKKQLLSQIVVKYKDNDTEKFMYSFEEAASRGQIKFKNIKNGIRVEYTIGREENRMLVPKRILKERFEENILDVYAAEINAESRELAEKGVINENLCYERDGKYYSKETGMELAEPILVREVNWRDYYHESMYTKIITESGNSSWFMFNKLRAHYDRYDINEAETETLKNEMILLYPICKEHAIYVFTPDATLTETMQIETLIKTYVPQYTYEELDKDHADAEYDSEGDKAPALFKLALEYTLDEWGMSVRVPVNGLRFTESLYQLTYISVLPFMGAGANYYLDDKTDTFTGYNFFPDGSGTLFRHEELVNKGSTIVSGKVYGQDYAYHEITGGHTEVIRYPVFGIVSNYHETRTDKQLVSEAEYDADGKVVTPAVYEDVESVYKEDRGFVAIIEEGDSLATLSTNHTSGVHKYNYVEMQFYPRPRDNMNLANIISVGSNAQWTVVSSRKYVGNYKIRYIMLTDEKIAEEKGITDYYSPTWMGMAQAYRDYLVSKGDLTKLTEADVNEDIPLYLQTFGTIETVEKILSVPVNVMTPLTTFEDIKTIYDDLAESGITNIKFRLTGFANGGMYSQVPYNLKWEKSVGGKDGYEELVKYANEKGFGIFPDFDFVYASGETDTLFDGLSLKKHAVRTINDQYTSKRYYSATMQTYVGRYELVISPAYFTHFYNKLSENLLKYYPEGCKSGISVATLGTDLNSDFDEDEPYHRADSEEFTVDLFKTMSEDFDEVMTDGANAYTWKYIDYIMNVPLDSSRFNKSSNAVPFIGVVLHSYVQMSGSPINMDGNIGYSFLKAIENGASINFTLCYQNYEKLKEDRNLSQYYSVRYDILKDDIVKYYTKLNELTRDLQLLQIVGHEFLIGERVPDADEIEADLKALEEAAQAEKEAAEAKLAEELRKKALSGRIDSVTTAQNALTTISNSYYGTGAVIDPTTGRTDRGLFDQLDTIKQYVADYKQATADIDTYAALVETTTNDAVETAKVLAEKTALRTAAKAALDSSENAAHAKLVATMNSAQTSYDAAEATLVTRKTALDEALATADAEALSLKAAFETAYAAMTAAKEARDAIDKNANPDAYAAANQKYTDAATASNDAYTALKNKDTKIASVVYSYVTQKTTVDTRLAALNNAKAAVEASAGKAQYDADNAVFLAADAEYNDAKQADDAAKKAKTDAATAYRNATTAQSTAKRKASGQVTTINSIIKKIENQRRSALTAADNAAYAAEVLLPDAQYSAGFKADVQYAKDESAKLAAEADKLFLLARDIVAQCYDIASEIVEKIPELPAISTDPTTPDTTPDTSDEEDDGEYKYTKYTDDGGNIVKVTYENGTFFILNYNFFDVTVVLDGTTYTIARNGGVKVTPDGNSVYFTAND